MCSMWLCLLLLLFSPGLWAVYPLSFDDLLQQIRAECTGFLNAMVGSSCFTVHVQESDGGGKNFSDALDDCNSRGERLAHFYNKDIWQKVKQKLEMVLREFGFTSVTSWIGLKSNGSSGSENFHWMTTSGQLMASSYADQEDAGQYSANLRYPNNPCGVIQWYILDNYDSVGSRKCDSGLQLYICEKVGPLQKYSLKAKDSMSENITSSLDNLERNEAWLCGLKCLQRDGCLGFNHVTYGNGACHFVIRKNTPLIPSPGINYYERND